MEYYHNVGLANIEVAASFEYDQSQNKVNIYAFSNSKYYSSIFDKIVGSSMYDNDLVNFVDNAFFVDYKINLDASIELKSIISIGDIPDEIQKAHKGSIRQDSKVIRISFNVKHLS